MSNAAKEKASAATLKIALATLIQASMTQGKLTGNNILALVQLGLQDGHRRVQVQMLRFGFWLSGGRGGAGVPSP